MPFCPLTEFLVFLVFPRCHPFSLTAVSSFPFLLLLTQGKVLHPSWVLYLTKFWIPCYAPNIPPNFLFAISCPFQTTGKGTASQRFSKTCVRSAQATGTQSPSLNAAATEGEAGVPTVRSALSRALWLSKNSAPMAEGLWPMEQVLYFVLIFDQQSRYFIYGPKILSGNLFHEEQMRIQNL